MAILAPPPDPAALISPMECRRYSPVELAQGPEGRLVSSNYYEAYRAWYDRSEYLHREQDELPDDLPPVIQFPIVTTVTATFHEVGRLQPLPFPDVDA